MNLVSKNTAEITTRDHLFLTIIELMKKKKISEITVKEIVYTAGVSRRTFYSYFSSLSDALHIYLDLWVNRITREVLSLQEREVEDYVRIFMKHWYQNMDFFKLLLTDPSINYYRDFSGLFEKMNKEISQELPREGINTTGYFSLFVNGGIFTILYHWTLSDIPVPLEDILSIVVRILDRMENLINPEQ